MVQAIKDRSSLKVDTDVEECAAAFIMIAKNTMMTGQSIAVGECSSVSSPSSFDPGDIKVFRGIMTNSSSDAGLNIAAM